jgi:hypothetical protein
VVIDYSSFNADHPGRSASRSWLICRFCGFNIMIP